MSKSRKYERSPAARQRWKNPKNRERIVAESAVRGRKSRQEIERWHNRHTRNDR